MQQDLSKHRSGKQIHRALWFPERERRNLMEKVFMVPGKPPVQPKYPVYIISKGRWESRLTVKALERMQVHYRIVVEPQEYEATRRSSRRPTSSRCRSG